MSKTQAEKRLAKVSDYQKTFSSPHGKRVLFDLMKSAHIMEAAHGPADQIQFREGERFQVIRILSILKTDFQALRDALEQGEE